VQIRAQEQHADVISKNRRRRFTAVWTGRLLLVASSVISGCLQSDPEWVEESDFSWRPLEIRSSSDVGFKTIDPGRAGIEFVNSLDPEKRALNRTLADGSGVAIGDVDGDGRADIYFASIDGPNALYHNRGRWRFDDVTASAGVALDGHRSTGVALADLDGDGDLDLIVSGLGDPTEILLNDGAGRFSSGGRLGGEAGSKSVTLADIDADHDLDLYITNNKARVAADLYSPTERSFERVVIEEDGRYRVADEFEEQYAVEADGQVVRRFELPEADELWLNDGVAGFSLASFTDGRFLDESGVPLVASPRDWGLSAQFRDLDGDRDPDLYVCNDFETPDRIWLNDGAGTFRAAPAEMIRSTSLACMSMAFGDVDRNGYVDFFTAEMLSRSGVRRRSQMLPMANELSGPGEIDSRPQRNRNMLQMARGDGTFAEVAYWAGVAGSEWTWGSRFMDVDLDGYEDLLTVTGHAWDELNGDLREELRPVLSGPNWRDERRMLPALELPNLAFRNRGDGSFVEVGGQWGFTGPDDVAHGLVTGDLDGDGDLDVVVTRLDAPPLIYENIGDAPRVAVRLHGRTGNTGGVGARVLFKGGSVIQTMEVATGDGYLSSSEMLAVFAAPADGVGEIEIQWPGGTMQRIQGVASNRFIRVHEPESDGMPPETLERSEAVWFEDASEGLGHVHREKPFDDFRRQALLPVRLSQLGPGVVLTDLDRDGDPDLAVTSGATGSLSYFRNEGGRFREGGVASRPVDLDQGAAVGLPTRAGMRVLVAQSNHESQSRDQAVNAPSVLGFSAPWTTGGPAVIGPVVAGDLDTAGPLALGDYDGDGDLDLFVGGRATPTAYPLPATSRLLLNDGSGRMLPDDDNAQLLFEIGLVAGAVFSDIDLDGDPDLLLAMDWGPVRVLTNRDGVFSDDTEAWGLGRHTGRWSGIVTGDFNEDGLPDIAATNWGLNTSRRASEEHPLTLFYGDFDRNGMVDIVEAEFDESVRGAAPLRSLPDLMSGMPAALRSVRGFGQFARSTVAGLLGPAMQMAQRAEATTLAHTLFINQGESFEAQELPVEAQLAPGFGLIVADFDADGHEDLFLGQNLFSTDQVSSRYDSGRSLIIRGDGLGNLLSVPGRTSGIAVYGDVRGAATADIDGDGRSDLVVSQNGAATKLYMNRSEHSGLRVRVVGPRGNPDGVGARIRLEYADGSYGPAREIQAGSGYWSQNGAVQVLGISGPVVAVVVDGPGGPTRRRVISDGERDIEIHIEEAGGG
jgi:enediyne biosynthesis protein E4